MARRERARGAGEGIVANFVVEKFGEAGNERRERGAGRITRRYSHSGALLDLVQDLGQSIVVHIFDA